MFTHLTRPCKFDTSDDDDRISSDKDGPMISGSAAQNCEVVCWFGRSGEEEEDASDICSPPLWKTSNPPTNYTQLSPAAKAQAVVRGQQELMEMIKNMPESSYELSLKDIVEQKHHRTHMPCEEDGKIGHTNPLSQFTKEELSKRKKTNGIMKSVDNGGFLLKMVLPFDFRSKGKKRIVVSESKHGCSKVSPRPSSVRTWDGLSWFGDNESIGRTSRSDRSRRIRSSSRTNINNNRVSSRIFVTGCWSVFSFNKKVSDD